MSAGGHGQDAGHRHDVHSAHGDWARHAAAVLEAAGYRRGGARRAVLEVLDSEPCAVTAMTLEERLRERGRSAGRASVYRTLEQLVDLNLVQKLDLGAETARYERVNPGGDHHHHMVCDECGKVLPFSDGDLERAVSAIRGPEGFSVRVHEVVLHGECKDCS